MPMKRVEPKVAFHVTWRDKNVPVYHVYKDDNWDSGTLSFWYTFDSLERVENEFDVRDGPAPEYGADWMHQQTVQYLVMHSHLKVPE